MGRLPTNRRRYQLKELWDRHQEINRRLAVGQPSVQIAEEMGITPVCVSYTKNSHLAQERRAVLQRELDVKAIDVGKRIRALAGEAVETLSAVMADPDGQKHLRVRVACDLLDRAGYGAINRTQNQNIVAHLTHDDLEQLKQLGRNAGLIVDTPIEAIG